MRENEGTFSKGDAISLPLGRAFAAADTLLTRLRAHPEVLWADTLGGLRRGDEFVGDVELLIASDNPALPLADLAATFTDADITRHDPDRLELILSGITVGIRGWRQEEAEARMLQLTGSHPHLEALRQRAAAQGLDLRPDGLYEVGGTRVAASEPAIYDTLGLAFVAPELRQGRGEIEAAARNELPRLVERADIRGDLHMHTQWSDGRDTVLEMAAAAARLGYEYIAITDHSASAGASRTLAADAVARQADDIAAAREQYPGLHIAHGCEVDILGDGRLDFPDDVLEQFDIVLASLHHRPETATADRLALYGAAMRHPLVSIVTHPSNRLFPHREGYDLDVEALCDIAKATGTALEIDGAPSHLDLNAAAARQARDAGATLCIDSDAHRTEALGQQMQLGLLLARQAWVEPRHVLNTRPWREIAAGIAAKRRGGGR